MAYSVRYLSVSHQHMNLVRDEQGVAWFHWDNVMSRAKAVALAQEIAREWGLRAQAVSFPDPAPGRVPFPAFVPVTVIADVEPDGPPKPRLTFEGTDDARVRYRAWLGHDTRRQPLECREDEAGAWSWWIRDADGWTETECRGRTPELNHQHDEVEPKDDPIACARQYWGEPLSI